MKTTKKLIEVALPLEAINKASAREKSIRHGHPSTLHLWWSRKPTATARAVIFAQAVDDPSEYTDVLLSDPTKRRRATQELKKRLAIWEDMRNTAEHGVPKPTLDEVVADLERERLFRIIEDLVEWENATNEGVLQGARDEIWQSWRRTCAENADYPRAKQLFDRHKLPAFHDPFAGGGSIPLEAQRLGLEAHASDLNPVAVLINKAMIEIPPRFANNPPVNPQVCKDKTLFAKEWHGSYGLAEDVHYYGLWIRDEAERRIGHLYPKAEISKELVCQRPDLEAYVDQELTVIAYLWARMVKSPNPAYATVDVPLVSSFMLSTKPGKEAYIEPVIEGKGFRFTVRMGKPKDIEAAATGTRLARGSFRCLLSNVPIPYEYIDDEANAGRMGERLMAIVAEGKRGRLYLPPIDGMEDTARTARPTWKPDAPSRGTWASNAQGRRYGFRTFGDYFTPRQLVALTTFSDLVQEVRDRVRRDASAAGMNGDDNGLDAGGKGSVAYADAVAVYLAFAIDRMANTLCTIARWTSDRQQTVTAFAQQGIAMTWGYPEANPFSGAAGDYSISVQGLISGIPHTGSRSDGVAYQADAQHQKHSLDRLISTDPPYYDNVGYADLSDFFYVWLRRSLRTVFPDLFATLASPKDAELMATPYRHGDRDKAEAFFLNGMTKAMHCLAEQAHPAFPVTIYYAFKQAETESEAGTANTGWETFLSAVIRAGFAISGTWPMRTELTNRRAGRGTNALASSIVLVCRKRPTEAPTATRRQFVDALRVEMLRALGQLQKSNIAPVDLAQAAIGPGMAVYSHYSKVLDAEGKSLTVREALALINQTLDEVLAEQEGDFDADSRWAITWFEENGFKEGEYGRAEQLSKSKNTSVEGMKQAGILQSGRGKVRLLKPDELLATWDPATDTRLPAWEIVHHLIRVLSDGGEGAAAELVAKLGAKAEVARELAYRLYTLCERKKLAAQALSYNGLVQSWPEITRLAREGGKPAQQQTDLFGQE